MLKNWKNKQCLKKQIQETDAAPVSEIKNDVSNEDISRKESIEMPSASSALVVKNTSLLGRESVKDVIQTQNVFTFSHMNGVHIGPVFTINGTSATPQYCHLRTNSDELIKRTKTIDDMMRSEEDLETKMLLIIASNLGIDYKNFLRCELGFSDAVIEQKVLDHHVYGTHEIIYQLILDWSRNNEGSLGRITTLLWKSGYRHVVRDLKNYWKTTINRPKIKEEHL